MDSLKWLLKIKDYLREGVKFSEREHAFCTPFDIGKYMWERSRSGDQDTLCLKFKEFFKKQKRNFRYPYLKIYPIEIDGALFWIDICGTVVWKIMHISILFLASGSITFCCLCLYIPIRKIRM